MTRKVLTYDQFLRDSQLGESLIPHMKKSKFKVGQMVRAGKEIGKIYSYRNGEYLVIIGSDQRSFAESELKPIKIKK